MEYGIWFILKKKYSQVNNNFLYIITANGFLNKKNKPSTQLV